MYKILLVVIVMDVRKHGLLLRWKRLHWKCLKMRVIKKRGMKYMLIYDITQWDHKIYHVSPSIGRILKLHR